MVENLKERGIFVNLKEFNSLMLKDSLENFLWNSQENSSWKFHGNSTGFPSEFHKFFIWLQICEIPVENI